MSDASVIGLGVMGTALVHALKKAGYTLTVWNRSEEKALRLADADVAAVSTIAEAVEASPIVIICVGTRNSTIGILDSASVIPSVRQRIVIQLSTGLPNDARDAEQWLFERGAGFLDGAILCGPQDVGTKDGQILLSGSRSAHEKVKNVVGALGGRIDYIDDNAASAATLELAWLSTRFGRFMGILHAANICRSEGVNLADFTSLMPDDDQVQHHGGTIRDSTYQTRSATLEGWYAALKLLRAQADDAGINAEFPILVDDFFARAIAAGYGDEHVMSVFKTFEVGQRD